MPAIGREDVIRKGSSVISATPTQDVLFEPIDYSLFNYLLMRTFNDLQPGAIHQIPVRDVMEYLRIDRIAKLHASLERLCKGTIMVDYFDPDTDEPRSIYAHYLSSDVSRTGGGMLKFAYDAILSLFLPDPKVYGVISVSRFRDFKLTASQKLYENMSLQFRKKHPVWQVTVAELRGQFQVGDRYSRFDNFRTHVIERAVDEVNAIAEFDVIVDYVRGGAGGGVVAVEFKAVPKSHRDIMQAAAVKSIAARKSKVDPHTVDLLDGMTFEERGGPAEITSEALERAREMMPEDGDINQIVSEWRDVIRGRSLRDPDGSFLSWLRLRLEQDTDPLLKDIDGDVFGSLLGDRD